MQSHLEFEIDGFRSLRGTKFRIESGLNILVGPNGSGKTNIVSALDFLSTFINDGAYSAVSRLGGASRVFSNEGFNDLHSRINTISFRVSGACPFAPPLMTLHESTTKKPKDNPYYILFSYHTKISLLKSDFSLQVTEEYISWESYTKSGKKLSSSYIEINSKDREKCKTDYKFDPEKFFGRTEFFKEEFVEQLLKEVGKSFQEPMKNAFKMAREGHSLFKWATPATIPELVGIERAFKFGRSFNISPDKVRAPEDIASKNEMMADGSGTISQLYKVKPTEGRGKGKSKSNATESRYEKVISNFKQLNEEISDLDIRPDIRTGKLDCKATIGFGPKSIKLPIISLSDGSAKWLAILTIVRLFRESYCIEEPENYLHPRAQRVFIEVLRGLIDEDNSRYFLITTHSETIVGVSKVSELKICDYGRGATHIRSVENPSAVDEAIADTGFGLGFFYANDRL